ncbi:MAG TPA: DUF2059 domain-containing protein [Pyrinomonadaceae bacterium]|nr:DUF2059 domain-containing protein [Pyrinomonadaceae bacterium]
MHKAIRSAAFLLALVLCAFSAEVHAQTTAANEKRTAIQELLNVIGATQTAKTIFVSLIDQYSQALARESIEKFEKQDWPPPQKERVLALTRDFYARLSLRLREEVPQRLKYDEKVNQLYLDAYDEYFTDAEVRDLITFFRGQVGQKFLGLGPQVGPALQKRVQAEMGEEIVTLTRAVVTEEVKRLEDNAAREFKASTGSKKE